MKNLLILALCSLIALSCKQGNNLPQDKVTMKDLLVTLEIFFFERFYINNDNILSHHFRQKKCRKFESNQLTEIFVT